MASILNKDDYQGIMQELGLANQVFQQKYKGESPDRQPVHTVYGGANLFSSDVVQKMGRAALQNFKTYAPNFAVLGRLLEHPNASDLPTDDDAIKTLESSLMKMSDKDRKNAPHWLSYTVYNKIIAKLEAEPIEDFRIDFEDGFGNRPDEEEDSTAVNAAKEVATGMKNKTLSPFIGIRIKPFTEDLKLRGLRTLDIFLTTLVGLTGGKLPDNFVVMLPKVTIPDQIIALRKIFEVLEYKLNLPYMSLKMETMVEATQAIMDKDGKNPLMSFVDASNGRLIAAHFGTYDYTASCNITAKYQTMGHDVCDFAHHMTKVALGNTGIMLSDGATNVMPVPRHRGDALTPEQIEENIESVHNAWRIAYDHTMHSLINGFYQGWDLHPGQLSMRYAAVYTFFLDSYKEAANRLSHFMDKSATATLTSDIFDDAATGQGLLNYFLRALNCGAISEEEVLATGLTLEEIQWRSFYKILANRKGWNH